MDPQTRQPLGMVTNGNGVRHTCANMMDLVLRMMSFAPRMMNCCTENDELCAQIVKMQGPSTWKYFNLSSQLFHLHALQQTGVEGICLKM